MYSKSNTRDQQQARRHTQAVAIRAALRADRTSSYHQIAGEVSKHLGEEVNPKYVSEIARQEKLTRGRKSGGPLTGNGTIPVTTSAAIQLDLNTMEPMPKEFLPQTDPLFDRLPDVEVNLVADALFNSHIRGLCSCDRLVPNSFRDERNNRPSCAFIRYDLLVLDGEEHINQEWLHDTGRRMGSSSGDPRDNRTAADFALTAYRIAHDVVVPSRSNLHPLADDQPSEADLKHRMLAYADWQLDQLYDDPPPADLGELPVLPDTEEVELAPTIAELQEHQWRLSYVEPDPTKPPISAEAVHEHALTMVDVNTQSERVALDYVNEQLHFLGLDTRTALQHTRRFLLAIHNQHPSNRNGNGMTWVVQARSRSDNETHRNLFHGLRFETTSDADALALAVGCLEKHIWNSSWPNGEEVVYNHTTGASVRVYDMHDPPQILVINKYPGDDGSMQEVMLTVENAWATK